MKVLLPLLFCTSITGFCIAQTGFFLTIDESRCEHVAVLLDYKQKYCITEEPIIGESEFKTEGVLQNDPGQGQFFNLRFSKAGFDKLKAISETMPQNKLVFVVKGKAVGTYSCENLKITPLIRISSNSDSQDLSWVFENLKKTF